MTSRLNFQVPLLEENSESNWVIDTVAKKTMISRLLTTMCGSVVTAGDQKKSRAAGKAKAKAKSKSKATAKAKSNAGNGASGTAHGVQVPNLPKEEDVSNPIVSCAVGVRQKLWLDDLLACVNHVASSVKVMSAGIDAEHINMLKSTLLRTGLLFAMKGSIVLESAKGTKTHKKWSTLRPALKEHGLLLLIQAWLIFLQQQYIVHSHIMFFRLC